MKILIIGENNINSLENIYKKNFDLLNCKFVKIQSLLKPKNIIFKKIINFQEKYFYLLFCLMQNFFLKKNLLRDKTIYDFIIVFNGYHLNKKIINILKKKVKKNLINIQTDNIFVKKNILYKNIKNFGSIYVWSKKLKKKIIEKYKINKKNIFLLYFAYDQFLKSTNTHKSIDDKILFYGSWDKDRESFLNKIDNKILKIYGNGWENANFMFKKKYYIKSELLGDKLVSEILKSAICINLFRGQAKNCINMRTFEVLGYGGRLVSEYSNEQKVYFKNFKNIFYFKNILEIENIYKKIISNKQKIIQYSKINKKKLIKDSYYMRAKYILENEKSKFN